MAQSQEPVEFPPRAPIIEADAADVLQSGPDGSGLFQPSHPIKQPDTESNEFQVLVRATILTKVRIRLETLARKSSDYSDVALGVAMLCFGGVIGALVSGTPLAEPYIGKLVYIALPVLGTAAIVSYVYQRRDQGANLKDAAVELLEMIPDPDRAEGTKVHEPK